MSHVSSLWVRSPIVLAGAASFLLLGTGAASAHVKWFCAFDVAGQPRGLEQVLCADFEVLTGLALLCLMFGCLAEGTPVGTAILNALDRVTSRLREDSALIVRAVVGFFLVSLWNLGGTILTPELKTEAAWIPWLQLAMAVCLLWKRTLPLTAAGIVFLFGFAVWNYGAFHLADYPVFLGVAAFLTLVSFDRTLFGQRPIDVVRIAAAITLMWASVEKWAYPHWTDPLIAAKPAMTMGATPELFMQAAGVIEFTLAFALIWTPLVRRASAIILTAVFVSAIFEFGKIDAIGHSGIIAVLIAIAADNARVAVTRRDVVLAPVYYASALMMFLGIYYLAHAALYGELYGVGTGIPTI
ncbi:hypothetical protein MPAR168_00860 [Methylorubrum populi]|uniref:Uncharacterized protein n=1 Tax=Methylobacterium radiotolerans TaxID=31998 RepID=A0ABU7T862_9HYPH|nr:hypothetical protein [Methylobacterium sp. B4]PXW60490.1 hypothetical protein BY998_10993 [Methylobacterium sp. B4]